MSSVQPTTVDSSSRPPRVAVLGATMGTGNLGVDALGKSMVQGLVGAMPNVEILYQCWDHRLPLQIRCGERIVDCEPIAIRRKNSIINRDGVLQMRRMGRWRKLLEKRSLPQLIPSSQALRQLLSCDAVVDVSAGDSFANIYGDEVFWYQTQLKLLCLELGLPLVLMPQTYGPFFDEPSQQIAADILSRTTLVCSREKQGLADIEKLCRDRRMPPMVRVPDMAFLLEPEEMELPTRMQNALQAAGPCIAINVSGLLYFARREFCLRDDFAQFTQRLLQWALSIPNSFVVLVPHVVAPTYFAGKKGANRSLVDTTDTAACEALLTELEPSLAERVAVLPNSGDPAKAKYAMMQCDYFVGARMHAFIGASSQCVPGSLLAYSKKAEGLANLLGIGDSVVDLRSDTISECLEKINRQFELRGQTKEHLEQRVPEAKNELLGFFADEIAPIVLGESKLSPSCASDSHQHELENESNKVLS